MITIKKRILVVEDHAGVLKLIELELKSAGYDVTTAKDGLQAMEQLRLDLPDILVLDLQLPGMNGLDILKQLRAFSRIPVIAISSSTELESQALKLGADTFIAKPFDPDHFVNTVKGLLGR
jgi:DNA-binding response OmpR family regulator